jgi:hypothetical protein
MYMHNAGNLKTSVDIFFHFEAQRSCFRPGEWQLGESAMVQNRNHSGEQMMMEYV